MFVSMSHAQAKRVSFLSLTLTFSLCLQARVCHPADALPFIAAKNLQTPVDAKLNSDPVDESARASKKSNESNDNHYVKLHAETMGISPKGPLDGDVSGKEQTTLPSKSLKVEIGTSGSKIDQARKVNLMPMLLMDTDAEVEGKVLTDRDCEKAQISDLWEATLSRNQDIQFVVQKLMPSSDRSHTTNVLMRMISSMIASGANTGAVVFGPNPATIMGSQMTANMIYQLIGLQEAKANKQSQIDQGQIIMLYQMVRNTAEKVTETYRDYKFHARRIDTAQVRALKLQTMIQDARAGQDAAKQLEMEYWVDKATADIEEAVYMARRYRHSLIDLAGTDAVCKLDQSFQDQFLAEKEIENKRRIEIAEGGKSKIPDRTKEALTKLLDADN